MKHLQQFSAFNEAKKEAKPSKKAELLEEIKSDLNRFRPGGDEEDAEIDGNSVRRDFRYLGNWEDDEENHDPDDDDDSWREDNDHQVWCRGEHAKYKAKFEDFCKTKPWFKKVDKLEIHGSEKNWVSFVVKLK